MSRDELERCRDAADRVLDRLATASRYARHSQTSQPLPRPCSIAGKPRSPTCTGGEGEPSPTTGEQDRARGGTALDRRFWGLSFTDSWRLNDSVYHEKKRDQQDCAKRDRDREPDGFVP